MGCAVRRLVDRGRPMYPHPERTGQSGVVAPGQAGTDEASQNVAGARDGEAVVGDGAHPGLGATNQGVGSLQDWHPQLGERANRRESVGVHLGAPQPQQSCGLRGVRGDHPRRIHRNLHRVVGENGECVGIGEHWAGRFGPQLAHFLTPVEPEPGAQHEGVVAARVEGGGLREDDGGVEPVQRGPVFAGHQQRDQARTRGEGPEGCQHPGPAPRPHRNMPAVPLGMRGGARWEPAGHIVRTKQPGIGLCVGVIRQVGEGQADVHHDHVSGAVDLQARLRRRGRDVPIVAHARTAELVRRTITVDELWDEGDVHTVGGRTLRVWHTPGHAPGHLVLIDEASGFVVAGDMVAGVGTIAIDPDEGDLHDYLTHLERLQGLAPSALLPAHGPVLHHSVAVLSGYIAHRNMRTEQIREALTTHGQSTPDDLAPRIYPELDPHLYPLAARQILTHLQWLQAHGVAHQRQGTWRVE